MFFYIQVDNEKLMKIISDLKFRIKEIENDKNSLKNEIEWQKSIFNELDDKRENDLRALSSAYHDIALKNFELETVAKSIINNDKGKNKSSSTIFNITKQFGKK